MPPAEVSRLPAPVRALTQYTAPRYFRLARYFLEMTMLPENVVRSKTALPSP